MATQVSPAHDMARPGKTKAGKTPKPSRAIRGEEAQKNYASFPMRMPKADRRTLDRLAERSELSRAAYILRLIRYADKYDITFELVPGKQPK